MGRALPEGQQVIKRFVGNFTLENGLQVHLRSFNVFNVSLWDDVMETFGELGSEDILVGKQLDLPVPATQT